MSYYNGKIVFLFFIFVCLQLDKFGRIDLLIGGFLCNDFFIVNLVRRGLSEGELY